MALWIHPREFGAKSKWPATFAASSNPPRPARTITPSFISIAARRRRCGAIPAFMREFERYGLRVIEPVTGRSWWTDRIWPEFDPTISAEAYVLDHVVPYVAERWSAGRRSSRSWASAWAARCAANGVQISEHVSDRGRDLAGDRFPEADRRRRRSRPRIHVPRRRRRPAGHGDSCTSIRSTGRGTSSSAAIRRTTAGTTRPTGCE